MATPQPSPPASRRRDKLQLSCHPCRARKLRCDRQRPCGTCASRCQADACLYPTKSSHPPPKDSTAPPTIQGRLNHLEDLVVQLMNRSAAASSEPRLCAKCSGELPLTSDTSPLMAVTSEHSTAGKLHCDASKTTYVSNAHWKAVLEGISELKLLNEDQEDMDTPSPELKTEYGLEDSIFIPGTTRERPRLLYGWHKPASVGEILAAMPERPVVDRLVLSYFHNPPIPHVLLHADSFLRQYEEFWADPFNTPLMWIALLYGIMSLATQADRLRQVVYGNDFGPLTPVPSMPPSRPEYLDQVEQSLIAGNYSNGGPFALEALLHYHILEHTRYPDADVGTWLLTGMVVRLGFRMGYHRDPSHFPDITPFQGEMRRRIWILVHALDITMSLQLGLPRIVKDGQWDTMAPRNLYDSDFDQDTKELPPSRPETEVTPMLHLLAKHKILIIIGTIADTSMSVAAERNDAATLRAEKRLMARLREAYDSVPANVRFDTLSRCLADKPSDIMNRLSMTLFLQKGLIVLNWHHVMPRGSIMSPDVDPAGGMGSDAGSADDNDGYQICIRAALDVLAVQETVDRETQPGGLLFPLHLLLHSVVKHEFLMATTVLITHMYRSMSSRTDAQLPPDAKKQLLAQEVEGALRKSHGIWLRQSVRSREAMRVANLLTMLFGKLQNADDTREIYHDGRSSGGGGGGGGVHVHVHVQDSTAVQSDDPGLALFGEFGLLHHLDDLSTFLTSLPPPDAV